MLTFALLLYRKETRLGSDDIGCVRINLAEYAGAGEMRRKYILEGADSHRRRLDNSILEVSPAKRLLLASLSC